MNQSVDDAVAMVRQFLDGKLNSVRSAHIALDTVEIFIRAAKDGTAARAEISAIAKAVNWVTTYNKPLSERAMRQIRSEPNGNH